MLSLAGLVKQLGAGDLEYTDANAPLEGYVVRARVDGAGADGAGAGVSEAGALIDGGGIAKIRVEDICKIRR